MKANKLNLLIAGLLALAIAMPAVAQAQESDGMAIVWHVKAKDGMDSEFEDAVKAFHEFMDDKEGRFNWMWYSILSGPDTGDYIARSGNHNWGDMDAEFEWEEEVNEYFEANVAPYVESAHRYFTVSDPENNNYPEDWSTINYIYLEDWHIRGGQGGNFNRGLTRINGLLKDGDFGSYWGFASNASGGHGNTVTLAVFHENWASMAQPSPSFGEIMIEAMGEEEFRRFMEDWGGTFKTGQSWTLAMRRDLNPTMGNN